MKLAAASAVVMTLLIELTAPLLIGIFTPDPEVIAAGALNLRIEVLGQVFYAIFISYHALMIGAGPYLVRLWLFVCQLHPFSRGAGGLFRAFLRDRRRFRRLCHRPFDLGANRNALYPFEPLEALTGRRRTDVTPHLQGVAALSGLGRKSAPEWHLPFIRRFCRGPFAIPAKAASHARPKKRAERFLL